MNLGMLQQMLGRVSERTKLIVVAVIAFLLGTLLTGHSNESANGRYVPWNEAGLLDTRTGQLWKLNPGAQRFERVASIPYF